jgi:hypothetical protein
MIRALSFRVEREFVGWARPTTGTKSGGPSPPYEIVTKANQLKVWMGASKKGPPRVRVRRRGRHHQASSLLPRLLPRTPSSTPASFSFSSLGGCWNRKNGSFRAHRDGFLGRATFRTCQRRSAKVVPAETARIRTRAAPISRETPKCGRDGKEHHPSPMWHGDPGAPNCHTSRKSLLRGHKLKYSPVLGQ